MPPGLDEVSAEQEPLLENRIPLTGLRTGGPLICGVQIVSQPRQIVSDNRRLGDDI